MEVTIILEDVNLFFQPKAITAKKSIRKSLRLSITKRLVMYAFGLVLGLILVAVNTPILGLAIIAISSGLFYIIEFFNKAFHLDINFSKEDELDKILKEDLYD
ncbi:hypothetical protein [Paucihalobacter sp.]|uniref:hypothetical protein n=1 Tax=Paucihalobacter sp. TaxID=2850405 RepID=UPI002FE1C10C